ncbi:hypothetical protein [Sphingobium sp. YR657]|uniref:hypothetical protein n=1 Tax=Sphingobium sp. YR657 TaxID=1884366 RepID=UPI001114DFC6|nr:hypothetical protein [Sphingobium sp. YR657]
MTTSQNPSIITDISNIISNNNLQYIEASRLSALEFISENLGGNDFQQQFQVLKTAIYFVLEKFPNSDISASIMRCGFQGSKSIEIKKGAWWYNSDLIKGNIKSSFLNNNLLGNCIWGFADIDFENKEIVKIINNYHGFLITDDNLVDHCKYISDFIVKNPNQIESNIYLGLKSISDNNSGYMIISSPPFDDEKVYSYIISYKENILRLYVE